MGISRNGQGFSLEDLAIWQFCGLRQRQTEGETLHNLNPEELPAIEWLERLKVSLAQLFLQ